MSRKANVSIFAVVLTLGLVAGFLADLPASDVQPAYALEPCKAANALCSGGADGNKTSTLDVTHYAWDGDAYVLPIEPDSGESWSITAHWNTNTLPCQTMTQTATVDVDWTGSGWSLSNKSLTADITGIQICSDDTCQDRDTHSWGYKLYVNINDPATTGSQGNLWKVQYIPSNVDDGNEVDNINCTEGDSYTWDDTVDGATDSGPFTTTRCTYACSIAGASVLLQYD